MHGDHCWPSFIRHLLTTYAASQREVCAKLGINRNTMHSFLEGTSQLSVDELERVLAFFGYELEAIRLADA